MSLLPSFGSAPFAKNSFWNTPIASDAARDKESLRWIRLLEEAQQGRGMHINLHAWTMPIFYAAPGTARCKVRSKLLQCNLSQGHVKTVEARLHSAHPLGIHKSVRDGVPIPEEAIPDGKADAHMIVVDLADRRAYDFWQCRRESDGTWWSNAAIAYDLDGPGVFTPEDIEGIRNDESVHFYGPCRASGVPALAGLIRREEIDAGRIGHKLAFACSVPALQRYVSPAVWTDGWLPGGLPEGCVLQLDPALDLDSFNLSPASRVVACALQEYGAVLVDYCGGVTLYGELLDPHPGQTWRGLLEEDDLFPIGFRHFRVLETGIPHEGGSHPVYHQGLSRLFYEHIEAHGAESLVALEPWRKAFAHSSPETK